MCINLAYVHHSILNSVGFKLNCWLIWNQTFVALVVDVSSSALEGTSQRH
jgi:hypothetical protein